MKNANNRVVIFLNPRLAVEKIVEHIKKTYGLNEKNGIASVKIVSDGSFHYKCYLDR